MYISSFKTGNKVFFIFDKIKVCLRLDDTSPGCTYPAKDTTENSMLKKLTLPNVKCKFKFNILIYSQKSDLLTYFEEGFYTKVQYFLNFKWETEVYLYFLLSLMWHLTYYFFQPFRRFCQYARNTTSNERLFKTLLFQFSWFMSKT